MRTFFLASSFLVLSGCSMIPSFYDDNESLLAVGIRAEVDRLNCEIDYTSQVQRIQTSIRYLELYSESKGSDDVYDMIQPMEETANGLAEKEPNKVFCTIKKKFLVTQSALVADALMERF